MSDPTADLPAHLRDEVRRILELQVSGGAARYQTSGDRTGVDGQKAISKLLQDAGIQKSDPRWIAINQCGRELYYGKSARQAVPVQLAPPVPSAPANSSGPVVGAIYTHGTSFRARAEATQSRFRVEALYAGCERYGHLLDQRSVEQGLNFLHPEARIAAERRAAAGKGVHRQRTFGNMLSSQAMCFNIFGPLAASSEGLSLASEMLASFIPGLARVTTIQIEYTPPFEIFQDQSGHAGVDCDVLINFEDVDGNSGILVIEMKFVEEAFSFCGHRKTDNPDGCPSDVKIGADFTGCRYVRKNGFLYWQRSAETKSLRLRLADAPGCPFGGPLWQIWVNHTLAYAIAAAAGATRAVFAVCASSGNETLLAHGTVLDEFRKSATDPASIVFLPLEELLSRLTTIAAGRPVWENWAHAVRQRYTVPTNAVGSSTKSSAEAVREALAITGGHRRAIAWMATQAFRDIVAVHRTVCGKRVSIYFRPTDKGIVRIALHPSAPGYVGFRATAMDEGYLLRPGCPVPPAPEVESHLRAFELWLPTVRRHSNEEQGVIPWLRNALEGNLLLPDLGSGWVLLHQEWRWITDAAGKKSDVLAVHVPTGQLGIVEFKSAERELAAAEAQVNEYGHFWQRHAAELAPVFTELLRALGAAYGNEPMTLGVVDAGPAKLFVGAASLHSGVHIREC